MIEVDLTNLFKKIKLFFSGVPDIFKGAFKIPGKKK